ncbi:IS1 family transposase [Microcoleus sp. B3-A4]|uniref:IS1 family transposase n=1 Tax=Microcoleus sp. B3-A4 TaxID=2818653 RepID=UPI002FD673D2
MKCPNCDSSEIYKNGHRTERQCYKCKHCGRQFLESYRDWKYSDDVKQLCLKMYLNGMGLRGIERVTGIHHTTIIHWIREAGCQIPDAPELEEIPEITDLDELQTNICNKRNKLWIWTAVNHKQPGVLAWTIGDHSAETFKPLWRIVKCWQCFFYVTDGWPVYPIFIEDADHIVSKTYMTRVEGENTRLRHYLARLHRKTLCYSKSVEMLKFSLRLLLHYLKYQTIPLPT